jgi:hypothetical protein
MAQPGHPSWWHASAAASAAAAWWHTTTDGGGFSSSASSMLPISLCLSEFVSCYGHEVMSSFDLIRSAVD